MQIFAADERLAAVIFQILSDLIRRSVHLAFHVTAAIVAAVIKHALIMHQSRGILSAELLRHLIDDLAAEGLIAAGPDQDRRMVLVSLIHGIGTVKQVCHPLFSVTGNDEIPGVFPAYIGIPGTVGLHISLIDHIQSVTVTQLIQERVIRIMAGADGIDIVPLHGNDVLFRLLEGHCTAVQRTEIMAVRTLEYDPLPVQVHHTVFHLKAPEAYRLTDHFHHISRCIRQFNPEFIKLRVLGAPQSRMFHRHLRLQTSHTRFCTA